MKKYNKIGIVVADVMEYLPLEEYAVKNGGEKTTVFSKKAVAFKNNGVSVIAVNCLIGKVNAAFITAALIDLGCDLILNFGLSGGIGEASMGKFVIPNEFLEHDFDMTVLGYKTCEKPDQPDYVYYIDEEIFSVAKSVFPDAVSGTAVCGDKFITSKKDADFFQNEFNATTCDMETAAIASVCHFGDIPFCMLRRISDGASEETVDDYRDMNENKGNILLDGFMKLLNAFC